MRTEEELFYEDIENEWKGLEKCIQCNHFDTVQCEMYPKMSPQMFGRRKKCKHFDDSYVPFGGEVYSEDEYYDKLKRRY